MTPEEFIERAKVGDIAHIRDEAPSNASGQSCCIIGILRYSDATSFMVETTGMTGNNGEVTIGFVVKKRHVEKLNNESSSGYDDLHKRYLAGHLIYARWYEADYFDKLTPCGSHEHSGKCSGYNSAEKNDKAQQFQKDVNFFFKDLAEEWVSPGENGFKFL